MSVPFFYFAWVGGTVPAQTLFSTRGNTHGAVLTTASITGDITQGEFTILNAGNTGALTVGSLYAISGAGIAGNATLVYDGGNTLQLSAAAIATLDSTTFTLTQAVDILNTTASIAANSKNATLGSTANLTSGQVYGILGAGIAQGTVFTFAGSASIVLSLAALDTFSPLDVVISGVPVRNPLLIDGIVDALSGPLTPGLTYNINGPGIPDGAGFVCPASGSAIAIDSPTTDSGTLVPLVITGPRIADGGGWSASLKREDEQILKIEIEQEEGDFASLSIDVRNPDVGLLSATRQVWGWLAWDDGTGNVTPLFHGRLIGIPADITREIITLKFVAQPNDFAAQKLALAAQLQVAPYWDPVWLQDKLADPDTTLESYSALWHVDRTSLVVTASDIVIGEDGTIAVGPDDHTYDSLTTAIKQPPLQAMTVTGTVQWTQSGDGSIDLTRKIVSAFQAGGSPYAYPLICSLTGDGLKGAWPTPGASIGGGWSFAETNSLVTATPMQNPIFGSYNPYAGISTGWITPYEYKVTYTAQLQQTTTQTLSQQFFQNWETLTVSFPLTVFQILLGITWAAARKRTETVTATLFADLQPVLTDLQKGEETLELNSTYVGEPINADGSIPITDLRAPSYFKTDRGAESFEYLLLLARAKLRARARCFEVGFVVPWSIAIQATCRKNVQLTDYRLPGGLANGKISHYRILVDAEGQRGEFKISCCIGRGNTVAAVPGVGDYAATGYMQPGYQRETDAQLSIVDGELTYETFDDFVINDDGVDLFNMDENTVLLNYTTIDVPSVGFSVIGDVTQGSTVIANLSDLSGFIGATEVVKTRTFGIIGSGIPLGATATYSAGAGTLTLNKPANFFPGRPINSIGSIVRTSRVSLSITGAHLTSGILQGGLRDQVNALHGIGVVNTAVNTGFAPLNQQAAGSEFVAIIPPTSFGRDPLGGIAQMPTVITLDLPDLTGEFATEFTPAVSPLMLPKTIDLTAGSGA